MARFAASALLATVGAHVKCLLSPALHPSALMGEPAIKQGTSLTNALACQVHPNKCSHAHTLPRPHSHTHEHPYPLDVYGEFPNPCCCYTTFWVKCLPPKNSFEKEERKRSGGCEEKPGCSTSGRNLVYDPVANPPGSTQEMTLAREEVIETVSESKNKQKQQGGWPSL